jgi:prevent-host-death family protein
MYAAKLTVRQVRDQLDDVLNRVAYRGDRVIIKQRGKRVAAVVPIEDLELLEALEDPADLEKARDALKAAESEDTVSWGSVKAELGL